MNSLTINAGGRLDVADGNAKVAYTTTSPLAAIQAYLRGGQIFSSVLTAHQAVADVDSGGVVQLTARLAGDIDGNKSVGFSDLVALAQNYGKTGLDWAHGDLNYDGAVGFADLVVLAQNYGRTAAALATVNSDNSNILSMTRVVSGIQRHAAKRAGGKLNKAVR